MDVTEEGIHVALANGIFGINLGYACRRYVHYGAWLLPQYIGRDGASST